MGWRPKRISSPNADQEMLQDRRQERQNSWAVSVAGICPTQTGGHGRGKAGHRVTEDCIRQRATTNRVMPDDWEANSGSLLLSTLVLSRITGFTDIIRRNTAAGSTSSRFIRVRRRRLRTVSYPAERWPAVQSAGHRVTIIFSDYRFLRLFISCATCRAARAIIVMFYRLFYSYFLFAVIPVKTNHCFQGMIGTVLMLFIGEPSISLVE